MYKWTSVDDLVKFISAVSQGDIDIASIDQKMMQSFKEHHEKKLVAEKVPYYPLYIVLTKV